MAQKPITPVKLNVIPIKEVVRARSFLRDDFPMMRQATIRLGICVGIAVLLIGGMRYFLIRQEENQRQAQAELRQTQEKYTTINNEKSDIREFQPRYVQLVEHGFVGEEKRLDVIERIRFIQEKYKLFPLQYEISPQQIVQLDPTINTGELELRGSKLMVRMALLHEMDMLIFLNELHNIGRFIPQTCAIKPNETASDATIHAQLQVECSLLWITMGRRVVVDEAALAVPTP